MTAPAAPAPGYYADPLDPEAERWWDGAGWTEATRPFDGPVTVVPEPVVARVADVEAGEVPQLAPDAGELAASRADTPTSGTRTVMAPVVAAQQPEPEPEPEPGPEPEPEPGPVATTVAPGFYPDPYGQAALRWWDGRQWTTATSRPEPVAQSPSTEAGTGPNAGPGPGAGSAGGAYRAGLRPGRPGPSTVPPQRSGGRSRGLSSTARRVGLPGLAAVVVLTVALGVRLFVLDAGPTEVGPAQLAAAINLRAGDLPVGWSAVEEADGTAQGSGPGQAVTPGQGGTSTHSSTTSPSGPPVSPGDPTAAFNRDMARCMGAPDPATAVAYTEGSPAWSRGASEISSEVVVLRSAALVQQDLRAWQGSTVDACMRRVGLPAMRAAFAPSGLALTGLAVQRLPGAAADSYALRFKMAATVKGHPVTVWIDSYGFARGSAEVGLTETSVGSAPDRAVAATALRQLRTRATATS